MKFNILYETLLDQHQSFLIEGYIWAWHTTAHNFDKFTKTKIGSGVGGFTHGLGFNVTNNYDRAKDFLNFVKGPNPRTIPVKIKDGKYFEWDTPVDSQTLEFIKKAAEKEKLSLGDPEILKTKTKTGEEFFEYIAKIFTNRDHNPEWSTYIPPERRHAIKKSRDNYRGGSAIATTFLSKAGFLGIVDKTGSMLGPEGKDKHTWKKPPTKYEAKHWVVFEPHNIQIVKGAAAEKALEVLRGKDKKPEKYHGL